MSGCLATGAIATGALATEGNPIEITVEIERPLGSRLRRGGTSRRRVRVAVTYRLDSPPALEMLAERESQAGAQNPPEEMAGEERLAAVIHHCVRSALEACDSICGPRPRSRVPTDSLASTPLEMDGISPTSEEANQRHETTRTEARHTSTKVQTQEYLGITSEEECQSVSVTPEQEQPKPTPSSATQKRTIEIMARQLGLEGQQLTDLLGLRCNRQRIADLTYREASGLIAYLSRLLRERLQKEKEDEARDRENKPANTQGGTSPSDAA